MEDQDRRTAAFPLSSILVILVALGVVVFTKTPLKEVRPAVPDVKEQLDPVRARLWQDPYRAVLDQAPSRPESIPAGARTPSLRLDRIADALASSGTGTVTILGVMVFGGPYIDDSEHRIRMRYAVLAGLRRLGYYPKTSDYLGYVRTDEGTGGPPSFRNILPFEWLEKRRGKNDEAVLVVWINEDVLQAAPLEQLTNGIKALRGKTGRNRESMAIKLIGPAGSTTLVDMFQELKSVKNIDAIGQHTKHADLEIFSPSATVDISLLREFDERKDLFSKRSFRTTYNGVDLLFERTIGTDSELARQLIRELGLRGVNLHKASGAGPDGPCGTAGNGDHVVLISEWDTFYGRTLPRTFRKAVVSEMTIPAGDSKTPRSKVDDTVVKKAMEKIRTRLPTFNYLRGMDGALPGDQQRSEKGSEQQARGPDLQTNTANLEQAMGRSQYDYLRRLADSVYRLDQDLQQKNAGKVRAIGILGSDFYDKYLVLQAMKQRFPGLIYFTTDLDARFLEQDHLPWTRNMIVASSYGLELPYRISVDGDSARPVLLQGEVPPFRDSYQTSVFLTIIHAFKKEGTTILQYAEPKIFEIGRQGAYDLTTRGHGADPGPSAAPAKRYLADASAGLKFMTIFSAAWLLLALSSRTVREFSLELIDLLRTKPAAASAGMAAILALILLFYRFVYMAPEQEPVSFFDGISIWPTEGIRLLAVVVSLSLIFKANRDLKGSSEAIDRDFGLSALGSQWETGLWKQRDKSRVGLYYRDDCRPGGMKELWQDYATMSNTFPRRVRIWGYLVACAALGLALMWTFGMPATPARGNLSWRLDKIILAASIGCFLYLTFLVVDASRLCRDFIRTAASATPPWRTGAAGWTEEEEGKAVRLIAKRTEAVGKLIFYPLVVWFVLFLSRMRFFDNWDTPLHLAVVMTLPVVYAWSCAYRLRSAAESARASAIERLAGRMVELRTGPEPGDRKSELVRFFMNEVAGLKQGAFASYMQSPVLQALLVPFGGVGGITLLDMFTKMNL